MLKIRIVTLFGGNSKVEEDDDFVVLTINNINVIAVEKELGRIKFYELPCNVSSGGIKDLQVQPVSHFYISPGQPIVVTYNTVVKGEFHISGKTT